MIARPTTTGSEPRSPERTLSQKARTEPPIPSACFTRSSLRSRSGAVCAFCSAPLVMGVPPVPVPGPARLAPAGAARNRIVRSARDGADEFLVRRVGLEDAVVPAEPEHDDAVRDRAHVLHVVANHDD